MRHIRHHVRHRVRHHLKKHVGVHHISTWKSFIFAFAIIIGGIFGMAYSIKAYPIIFKTDISMEKRGNIKPDETLAVDFSFPMPADTYMDVKVFPDQEIDVRWQNPKRLLIAPKGFWKIETDYAIIFPETRNAMFSTVENQKLHFFTEAYPEISSVSPEDNSKNAIIDIEDPITVIFQKPASNFYFKFELEPQSELAYQNNSNKTQFELMPKNPLGEGKEYSLKIYAKFFLDSDSSFKLIHESSFETPIPASEIVWDKDYDLRLAQAKNVTRPKITSGKYIDINLKAQVLSIFKDGENTGNFMISSGKKGMDTPKGESKIYNKFPRAYSKKYGLFMPNWMAMASDGKFGIHELPEWPNGYKEGTSHLGTPVSHGCVRLGVGAAKAVYDWAEVGTPVVVY